MPAAQHDTVGRPLLSNSYARHPAVRSVTKRSHHNDVLGCWLLWTPSQKRKAATTIKLLSSTEAGVILLSN
jgi:hypothetical protein